MNAHCPQCQGQVYAGTTQAGMVFENCPGVTCVTTDLEDAGAKMTCAACVEKDAEIARQRVLIYPLSQAKGDVARLTAAVRTLAGTTRTAVSRVEAILRTNYGVLDNSDLLAIEVWLTKVTDALADPTVRACVEGKP